MPGSQGRKPEDAVPAAMNRLTVYLYGDIVTVGGRKPCCALLTLKSGGEPSQTLFGPAKSSQELLAVRTYEGSPRAAAIGPGRPARQGVDRRASCNGRIEFYLGHKGPAGLVQGCGAANRFFSTGWSRRNAGPRDDERLCAPVHRPDGLPGRPGNVTGLR